MADDDIPVDADHWLFAEDLINFVFRHHAGFPISPISEECRGLVRKGFSDIVRSAVEIIEKKLEHEIEAVFTEISLKADVIEEYKVYASDLRKICGSNGFDGNKFLHYCVHVSCLGERFYRTELEEFHYLAFTSVREALKGYNMSNGGWDTLDLVADAITNVEEHFVNLPSPEYEPTDYEQSTLNANIEPEHVNRTWNLLHENVDRLSEDSASGTSSNVKDESSDFGGSVQSDENDGCVDTCKELGEAFETDSRSVSSDDSSSKYIISLNKVSAQSNIISSSTEVSKLPAEMANPKEICRENNTRVSDSQGTFNHSLDGKTLKLLDVSKNSDQKESCTELQLNVSSSKSLSHSFSVSQKCDINGRAVSKTLCISSEYSSVVKDSREAKKSSPHLFFSHDREQPPKLCSESKGVATNSQFFTETQASNSEEHSSTVSQRSDGNESDLDELQKPLI